MLKSVKRKERRQEQKASYLAGMSRKSYKHRSALNVGLDEDGRTGKWATRDKARLWIYVH